MSGATTNQLICISTTTANKEKAESIASVLVDRRLAACVQILGPIQSIYRWQGNVEQSEEWLCVAKTTEERFTGVEAAIREHHDYDEPEIIATPIVAGSRSYLDWVRREVT